MKKFILITLFVFLSFNIAKANIDDYASRWTLDIGRTQSGASGIIDSGSSLNHGTETGTFSGSVLGKMSQALTFDGSTNYITLNNNVDPTGTKSFSYWFKSTDVSLTKIHIDFDTGTNDYLICSSLLGTILCSPVADNTASKQSTAISNNIWYNVVVVKTAQSINNIYINGKDATVAATNNLSNSGVVTKRIGGYQDGSLTMNGMIDDVRVYNRQLTQNEAMSIYRRATRKHNLF